MSASKPNLSLSLFLLACLLGASSARAQTVKVTPLGARTGEFCTADRAMLFEDPTGVRILYDAGRTIAGGADSRLGAVHAILLTHVHSDHLGNDKLNQDPNDPASSCAGNLKTASALPNSNTAEIAVAKNSAVIVSADVSAFLGQKMQNLRGGTPTPQCAASNEIVVPRTSPCRSNVGFGAKRTVTMAAGAPGVRIAIVPAQHGNGLDPGFLAEPEKTNLAANGLLGPMGPAQSYLLTFTNGLTVFLSGDTGHTSDMATIVRDFYRPNLAVFNIGDIFTTGPEEAAFAVTQLLGVGAVIPSHANEVATTGGAVNPGTKTARFIDLVGDLPVYLPLSGITLEFDGSATCANCGGDGDRAKPQLRAR
jgi:L-ascorbate metabolism protein UlaG (beta-lactamase superfamily)